MIEIQYPEIWVVSLTLHLERDTHPLLTFAHCYHSYSYGIHILSPTHSHNLRPSVVPNPTISNTKLRLPQPPTPKRHAMVQKKKGYRKRLEHTLIVMLVELEGYRCILICKRTRPFNTFFSRRRRNMADAIFPVSWRHNNEDSAVFTVCRLPFSICRIRHM